jgi:hypothetical protein
MPHGQKKSTAVYAMDFCATDGNVRVQMAPAYHATFRTNRFSPLVICPK